MPTYEYRCNECGHRFELFQAMTADPVATCPKCNGPVTRLIGGGSAILFKGAGFHATDYDRTKAPACGRDAPCCGRETPCDRRPCEP
jgi:putative FmdB family regulatory protein